MTRFIFVVGQLGASKERTRFLPTWLGSDFALLVNRQEVGTPPTRLPRIAIAERRKKAVMGLLFLRPENSNEVQDDQ